MKEEKKKTTFFLRIFNIYPSFLLKLLARGIVGCRIKLCIQRVSRLHTFDGPHCPKIRNNWKTCWWYHHHVFHVFLVFGQRGPSKVCNVDTHWMRSLILHPMSPPTWNLRKNIVGYVENKNKKIVFLWQIYQVNHYGWLILLKFYWFLNSNSSIYCHLVFL